MRRWLSATVANYWQADAECEAKLKEPDCHLQPAVFTVLNSDIRRPGAAFCQAFMTAVIKETNHSKHMNRLLQRTHHQTLKHQADNYVQKDANSSGRRTDRARPPCERLARPGRRATRLLTEDITAGRGWDLFAARI